MKNFYTTCARDCYDACGIEVIVDNEKFTIKGDKNHPITQGFLCPRGNNDFKHITLNRVDATYFRTFSGFEKIVFTEGIKIAADKIQETIDKWGREAILYLDFAGNEGIINNIFVKRLWNLLKVSFTDQALCTASGHFGISLHYGKTYGLEPEDLLNSKLIVFWGVNAVVSAPHIWKIAIDARKKGAKIITIDIYKSPTAKLSDYFFQVESSSDVLLALALAKMIVKQMPLKDEFINKYIFGYTQFCSYLESLDLNFIEKTTKLSFDKIKLLSNLYIENAPKTATLIGVSLQKRYFGYENTRAISLIPALLGQLRGFFYSNSQSHLINYDFISGKFLNRSPNIVPQVNLSEHLASDKIKLIFVNSMNPLLSLPDSKNIMELLRQKNVFLIVNETHWSETASNANLVFGVPTFYEKEDFMPSWSHSYLRKSPKIINLYENTHTELEIVQELAKVLGIYDEDIFDVKKVLAQAFEGIIDNTIFNSSLLQKMKTLPKDQFQTPSGKIELYSQKALSLGLNPFPAFNEIKKSEQEFWLVTVAHNKYTNSQFTEVFGSLESYVCVNSELATRLGIIEHQIVCVFNQFGELFFKIKIVDELSENVILAHRFVKDLYGIPINSIVPPSLQDFTKGPTFHSTKVFIKF